MVGKWNEFANTSSYDIKHSIWKINICGFALSFVRYKVNASFILIEDKQNAPTNVTAIDNSETFELIKCLSTPHPIQIEIVCTEMERWCAPAHTHTKNEVVSD